MPSPLKTYIFHRVARSRGPINQLKANRWGWDWLRKQAPTLELYYEAGDPHSHLCAQWLRAHPDRIRLPVQIRMVPAPEASTYPEADKQRAWAIKDAQRIAPALGLRMPSPAVLADAESRQHCAERLQEVSHDLATWLKTEKALIPKLLHGTLFKDRAGEEHNRDGIAENAKRRSSLGHYLPAMWQFDGDWFWGVDRMDHLENALRRHDGIAGSEPLIHQASGLYALPDRHKGERNLEFFYSFRSPYSYLAAERLRAQYSTNSQPPLVVRPVLPMAMRGLRVPLAKRLYIVRDVYRQAGIAGVPFGRIADPIGAGAIRCLQVFPLALGADQQLKFCHEAGKAVWSQAVDVASDSGLRKVCERSDIAWSAARERLQPAPAGLEYAEANRQALFEAGCWGVPTFRVSDFVCWGHDRMDMLDEYLRRHSLRT